MNLPRRTPSRAARRTRTVGLAAALLVAASFAATTPSYADQAATRTGAANPAAGATNPAARAANQAIRIHRWSTNADFRAGARQKVRVKKGSMRIAARPKGTVRQRDPHSGKPARRFDYARWISPWTATGFDATNLVPSWNVRTPKRTFVRIQLRTRSGSTMSSWDTVADWARGVQVMHRHSGGSQPDDLNKLLTDTLVSQGGSRITQWQVKVTLFRPEGTKRSPTVDSIGAVAAEATSRSRATSKTRMKRTTELRVPRSSQMIHSGHYPQWDNGGEAWCSPTSTSMVLRFFGTGPKPAAYAWTGETEGQVDYAARYTYDHAYEGAGNWPFNTAYAGTYRLDAFVTRMLTLRDAERFIRHGIPVVTSIAFSRGQLDGSPLTSTNGHLVVVVGFTGDGRVIVNDPAAPKKSTVRRVYRRDQFERAWLGGSGGIAYVMHPSGTPLPSGTKRW